jgi:putative transposase
LLADWPEGVPADWVRRVNQAQTAAELEALRRSVVRDRPFGSEAWTRRIAKRLGLEYTLRPRGRPRKSKKSGELPF